jgi:hypothetical protein
MISSEGPDFLMLARIVLLHSGNACHVNSNQQEASVLTQSTDEVFFFYLHAVRVTLEYQALFFFFKFGTYYRKLYCRSFIAMDQLVKSMGVNWNSKSVLGLKPRLKSLDIF